MSIPSLVILSGVPASGKSTFFNACFRDSHARLNLDEIKSRTLESEIFLELVANRQNILVDNTNPTKEVRARYIDVGLAAGYRIVGYQFQISIQLAIARNRSRKKAVSPSAIYAIAKQSIAMSYAEGFHEIFIVDSMLDRIIELPSRRTDLLTS